MFDLTAAMRECEGREIDLLREHVNPAMAKVLKTIGFDVRFTHGRGAYLFDEQGRQYIDCLGGYAALNVGRNHPVVRDALKQAMDMDLPNIIKMGVARLSGLLARELLKVAPPGLERVFYCNSGSEGVETAIKFARAATGRPRIVHCSKAFHGLTLGSLSVNGNAEFRDGFGPLLDHCSAVPFNDLDALDRELSRGDAAAFIVEPIQGKGVNMPDDGYLRAAASLCHQHGAIFIVDEVQTGFGRTGRMFACEHWGVEPDVLVTAKGLSGGYIPVAAVLARKWIHEKTFSSMDRCVVHSTTFGQNDLAMAAGLATLYVLREEKLVEQADRVGARLRDGLAGMIDRHDMVREVRGKGLMIAVEFGPPRSVMLRGGWTLMHKIDQGLFPQAVLIPLLQDHRILAQVAGHHLDVIKLIPPLVLSDADADQIIAAFDQVVAACHRFPGPMWEVGKRLASQAVKRKPDRDRSEAVEV
jgi:ornithine--oxo-acid transaminase